MTKLIITIDGPAASGKSTAARLLAERIGASFLDTGAMYRAVTLAAMQADVDMKNEDKLLEVLENARFEFKVEEGQMLVAIDGQDATDKIRDSDVTANAKCIASSPKLRERLVDMQRDFAEGEEKIVTEGRDQGTVVFKDADIKFFLVADLDERARRRQIELSEKGGSEDIEQIKEAIRRRDESDRSRSAGPLKPADDAIIIDTTELDIDDMVATLLGYIQKNA